jgi:hypothetical protein
LEFFSAGLRLINEGCSVTKIPGTEDLLEDMLISLVAAEGEVLVTVEGFVTRGFTIVDFT